VSNIEAYFSTDWAAMTSQDWSGMLLTVAVFIGMAVAFFYALRPKNAKRLEEQRMIPLRDEDQEELRRS
jgi:cbb3-type cytochrome oxidase subunit 3